MSNNALTVSVEYTEGYRTEVRFHMVGPVMYRLEVLNDTDFFPPFLAVQHLKSMVYAALEDIASDMIASLEEKIGSRVRDMDGKQLTCLALTLSWLNYLQKHR